MPLTNHIRLTEEATRLRKWLEAELANSGDAETMERLRDHLVTSFVWKAKLH